MIETLRYILDKFHVNGQKEMPIKLSLYRFKGLLDLFRELGFATGAEIGVSNGRYSWYLCKHIPGLKLYCVDPWLIYPEFVEHHKDEDQAILDKCFETAKRRLARFDCEFITLASPEAAMFVADESLDFVFIDGNHRFEYVVADIAAWTKKVRAGGIISGHDFWNSGDGDRELYRTGLNETEKIKLVQVKEAVLGWTRANKISPWFVTTRDSSPSWLWVKT